MDVAITPQFKRMFKKLEPDLKRETLEKIEHFKLNPKQDQLRAHKLKGRLKDRYSFSVNYQIRIIYCYLSSSEVALLAIGGHEIYKD
ncbi:MAG TPA: type II toxin-antitoxin system mRNA interferase toxin, RelE/StbE family [Candidatus Paceibacterota bacterium]|nr:type II toxin-antitoxin system mRNA interferase toxin, RelE/StbE family [Candidatus Paceibacterota bacterium]HMO82627.1 type II toxin-antitoxin system mRNA interferase toxin, RelE/StbE family [Candidatus Paceibacterota bacterium]